MALGAVRLLLRRRVAVLVVTDVVTVGESRSNRATIGKRSYGYGSTIRTAGVLETRR